MSNIAWPPSEVDRYLDLLRSEGCSGVEIAASLLWPEPTDSVPSDRHQFRQKVEDRGLRVTGLQALLFLRPDLQLFVGDASRRQTVDYLIRLMDVCVDLGGDVLVFGSPQNRNSQGMEITTRQSIATDVMGRLAEASAARGLTFCIEPLGPSETDFINSTREAVQFLDTLGWPSGLGLHVDIKAVMEAGETTDPGLIARFARARHVHVNDPGLQAPGSTGVDHTPVARALIQSRYDRFLSIEMRRVSGDEELSVRRAIRFVKGAYTSSC